MTGANDIIAVGEIKLSRFSWKVLCQLDSKPTAIDRRVAPGLIRKGLARLGSDGVTSLTLEGKQAVQDYYQQMREKFPAQFGDLNGKVRKMALKEGESE